MKSAAIVTILFVTAQWAFGAAAVAFDDQRFELAWANVDKKSGTITNEFLRKGETLKKWKIMLSARYFPKAKTPQEVAGAWVAMLKGSNSPGMSISDEKIEGKAPQEELMFFASIRAPDDSYLELCYCRIVKETGADGIKMYQVSRRVDPNDEKELTDAFMQSASLKAQVKAMFVDVVTSSAL